VIALKAQFDMEIAMVLERAEVIIKQGLMDEFLEVLTTKAIPLTTTFTGIISFKALRGVEDENSVMFLAEWASIEAHLASRREPAHAEFRNIVVPYTSGAKQTVHFKPV
jgi:quinol monooxygenase YgiN